MKLIDILYAFIIILSIIDIIFFVVNTHPWSEKSTFKLIVPVVTSSALMVAWGISIFVCDILMVSALLVILYCFALVLRAYEFKTYYETTHEEPKNIRVHVSELQKNKDILKQMDQNKKTKF